MASVSMEEQAANHFVMQLNELKDEEKKVAEALKSRNTILVQSAFDLLANNNRYSNAVKQ